MKSIKIDVSNNIAQVKEKPKRIVAGTIGLPVEFTFDSVWDGVVKMAVFSAGGEVYSVDMTDSTATVPWEVLQNPGPWLMIGVYGEKEDGTEAIPTIWANVAPIRPGTNLFDVPTNPSAAPVWQKLRNEMDDVREMVGAGYIADTNINEDGELELTHTNGTVKNVGRVVGEKGEKGDMVETVDNLLSTDTEKALSANQGRVLNAAISLLSEEIAMVDESSVKTINGAVPDANGNIKVEKVSDAHINDLINTATNQRLTDLESEVAQIIADKNYKDIAITKFTCPGSGTHEIGTVIAAPTITWTLNKDPESQTLNGETLGITVRSKVYTGSVTTDKTYTLKATGQKGEVATASASIKFLHGVYYGVLAVDAAIDNDAILSLTRELRGDFKKTYPVVTAGAGQRHAFAFPTKYGTPVFKDADTNLGADFYKATTFMFTNASLREESYDVWLATNPELGSLKVTIG